MTMVQTEKDEIPKFKAFLEGHFYERWGILPQATSASPGRVNLIGEYTDFNLGFVLPMALDREIYVAGSPRKDRVLRVFSADYNEQYELKLNELDKAPAKSWVAYVAAVYSALQSEGYNVVGADLIVQGDLPQGTGLSSSAALELAVARMAAAHGGWAWDAPAMAQIGQLAENKYIGVQCGIMDQFAVAAGTPRSALFLDCRSLVYESVPVNFQDARFVVINSGVRRQLHSSAYNERRSQCEQALKMVQTLEPSAASLRDATPLHVQKLKDDSAVWYRRLRHVVSENQRVNDAVQALRRSDAAAFGALMLESHRSLATDFEVSCPELDTLVRLGSEIQGVHGSRLTGAGFGGCTIHLVDRSQLESFASLMTTRYHRATGLNLQVIPVEPGKPTRLI
jgi:galactokinase